MKNKTLLVIASILSVIFVLVKIWNGFTRSLGSYYDPSETRHDAVVGGLIFAGVTGLILFGLLYALNKRKLFADIAWILIAPALFMLIWDTITKNLVERGKLATGWLTDSAYLQSPGARLHRNLWIILGLTAALPFIYNLYLRFSQHNINE